MVTAGLEAIRYQRGKLQVLDQLRLPHEHTYEDVSTCEQAFDCIKTMRVRGAPAIAIVAALALAVELNHNNDDAADKQSLVNYINDRLDYLYKSRPTAVDLSNAISRLKRISVTKASETKAENETEACSDIRLAFIEDAEDILKEDTYTNREIGRHGAEFLRSRQSPIHTGVTQVDDLSLYTTSPPYTQGAPDQMYRKFSVLTHCNTGSLATSGHGTALGIIRSCYNMNYLNHAYCTETRPYNQGSRLTAFELAYEEIPATLITDSMAGALFRLKKEEKNILAVIVGADRVVRNGDTANKIGTYSLAVLAKKHGIKFIVAAPTTSIDLKTESGDQIEIEERPHKELTQISGAIVGPDGKVDVKSTARVAIAHQGIDVWNPAFDVTPHDLIDAIVTEKGVVEKLDGVFRFQPFMPERWRIEVESISQKGSAGAKGFPKSPADEKDMLFKLDDVN